MTAINSVNDRLAEAEQDLRYEGYAIGYVTENHDPEGIGRIKVKVPNVLDSDQGPIPWCLPTKNSPWGQGPGYGVYGSPKIGSPVRISFQDGDPHYPIYECDEYLKAHANPKFKEPDTWGFKDWGGSELWVNMTTGAWEFVHQSGSFIKYDGQGNVNTHVQKAETHTVVESRTTDIGANDSITIHGNEDRVISGNAQQTVQGTLNLTVSGAATITAQSGVTINVTGDVNLTASGNVNIQGAAINLN
jgi:uncharacterized protein involved in type VI secretion and phage assembly